MDNIKPFEIINTEYIFIPNSKDDWEKLKYIVVKIKKEQEELREEMKDIREEMEEIREEMEEIREEIEKIRKEMEEIQKYLLFFKYLNPFSCFFLN